MAPWFQIVFQKLTLIIFEGNCEISRIFPSCEDDNKECRDVRISFLMWFHLFFSMNLTVTNISARNPLLSGNNINIYRFSQEIAQKRMQIMNNYCENWQHWYTLRMKINQNYLLQVSRTNGGELEAIGWYLRVGMPGRIDCCQWDNERLRLSSKLQSAWSVFFIYQNH